MTFAEIAHSASTNGNQDRHLVIRQKMLKKLQELNEQAWQRRVLRNHVRILLERGARIEPGTLTVELRPVARTLVTLASLRQWFDEDVIESLQSKNSAASEPKVILHQVESGRREPT